MNLITVNMNYYLCYSILVAMAVKHEALIRRWSFYDV